MCHNIRDIEVCWYLAYNTEQKLKEHTGFLSFIKEAPQVEGLQFLALCPMQGLGILAAFHKVCLGLLAAIQKNINFSIIKCLLSVAPKVFVLTQQLDLLCKAGCHTDLLCSIVLHFIVCT